jgi:hypothetical protein
MAESGSETRQRTERYTVRFTPLEHALICANAKAAGVPVATFLRCAALDFPIPRAARRPTTNHKDVVLLAGRIGQLATAFRSAAELADAQAVETALRDFSEIMLLCFTALGAQAMTALRGTNMRGRWP